MNAAELKTQAMELERNQLLPLILDHRRQTIIDQWRMASDTGQRELHWHALRQLDELAGAINDAIREHGGSR